MRRIIPFGLVTLIACAGAARAQEPAQCRFDFGPGVVADGFTKVNADAKYSDETGYGFVDAAKVEDVDRGGDDPLCDDFCTSAEPFAFAVRLPEGNYHIKATLG